MTSVFHGGRLDAAIAKFGGEREDWLDLSTGINPNSYPVPDISANDWGRLPDNLAMNGLLQVARDYYGVPASTDIVAAGGTQALIQLLPNVLKADRVGIVSPTYAEYQHVWNRAGTNVLELDGPWDIPDGVDGLVLVNPNNPDGKMYDAGDLLELAAKVSFLVVDEAFADTSPETSVVQNIPANVLVLKSFGKFFGLAGARLGFAICKGEIARRLIALLGPWPVSGPAIAVATKALADEAWISSTRNELREMSEKLAAVLEATGSTVVGGTPLFMYIHNPRAEALYQHLACNQILVRAFPERKEFLRIGIPADQSALERLEDALKSFSLV